MSYYERLAHNRRENGIQAKIAFVGIILMILIHTLLRIGSTGEPLVNEMSKNLVVIGEMYFFYATMGGLIIIPIQDLFEEHIMLFKEEYLIVQERRVLGIMRAVIACVLYIIYAGKQLSAPQQSNSQLITLMLEATLTAVILHVINRKKVRSIKWDFEELMRTFRNRGKISWLVVANPLIITAVYLAVIVLLTLLI